MKIKKIILIFVCASFVFFLLGASGVTQLAKPGAQGDGAAAADDKLIGVFITREPLDLFDFENYFNDNAAAIMEGGEISGEDMTQYEGRLYAVLKEVPLSGGETETPDSREEYVFEGVDGIRCFAPKVSIGQNTTLTFYGDDGLSDVKTAYNQSDDGETVTVEGTVYVAALSEEVISFYFNPVYQTAAGEVYALSGQGSSFGGDLGQGAVFSHEINEKTTETNGEESESSGSSVKLTISYVDAPTGISVIMLGGDSSVLSRTDYWPGKAPDEIKPVEGTQYIIVETRSNSSSGEQSVNREIYQRGDESLYAFYCRSDGICVKQYCGIAWES